MKPTQRIVATGILAVGTAVAFAATAGADPAPPPGPPVPGIGAPLGPNGLSLLGQAGTPAAGPIGLPQGVSLDPNVLLAQNATPGGPPGGPTPTLNAFNNAYLLPQNETPSAPGQGTEVGVEPGQENADLNRRGYLQQLHELYRNGNLRGAALGQMPKEQLGEPLPGTAPPPGTNIPPGLMESPAP